MVVFIPTKHKSELINAEQWKVVNTCIHDYL